MAHFPDKSWYDKLARFYLRHKRDAEFEQLTRDAVKTFQGTSWKHISTTWSGAVRDSTCG